jgi:hypothetical protein
LTKHRNLFLSAAIAAACGVLGCTPFAGINPTANLSPAAARGFRLKGTVLLNDAPVPNAHMRAFDLATGRELVLVPYSETGAPRPAAPTRTLADGQGAFDYELPIIRADQVIKVVAEWDGRALVGLVDGTGRTVGAAPEASLLRLAQAGAATLQLTINLRLTAATTSAAKSFEGVLKTTFQLRGTSAATSLEAAMKAAAAAIEALERALARQTDTQDRIAIALDDRGEFDPTASFQTLLNGVGMVDPLLDQVEALLGQFAETQQKEAPPKNPNLDAITQEDFPLGRIKITLDGSFSYTDEDGKTTTGTFGSGQFVPNDAPTTAPSSAPTAAPTTAPSSAPTSAPSAAPSTGGGGSGGGGNTDQNFSTVTGGLVINGGGVADEDPSATLTCETYDSDPTATRTCTERP